MLSYSFGVLVLYLFQKGTHFINPTLKNKGEKKYVIILIYTKYCQFFHSLVGLRSMMMCTVGREKMSINRDFPLSLILPF